MQRLKFLFYLFFILQSIGEGQAFWFTVPKKKDVIVKLGVPTKEELSPNKIDILVWNIYKGKNDSWEEDFNYLSKNNDILILQEGRLNNKMTKTLTEENKGLFVMGTSFIYKKSKERTGVVTGSKVKPRKIYHKKSKNVEWVGLTPKVLLFTEYNISGSKDTLLVINIHAVNTVPTYALARQIKQAGRKIKKHQGPVIFAGDFNVWNKKKTEFMKKYLTSIGMEEMVFPNGEERMKFKLTNKVLDYIWIRGLEYSDAYVWSELEGADHKAMTATLRVK